MRLNGFTNVTAIQAALSDKNSIEKLYINSSSTGHSLLPQLAKNSKTSPFIPIEVKTLDTVLQQLQVNKIDVIKIDAEGMEIPILQGATQTLKNNPQAKIIVASYHYPEEIQEVQSFLETRGFKTSISYCDIITAG